MLDTSQSCLKSRKYSASTSPLLFDFLCVGCVVCLPVSAKIQVMGENGPLLLRSCCYA